MNLDGCNALITGASAGIGREFARQLAGRARTIVLVARRRERLEQLRDELKARNSRLNVHTHPVDLNDGEQIQILIESLKRENIAVDLLINDAGLGDLGPFATSDLDRTQQIIRVNILALTSLTRRLVPAMIAKKRGGILNVSSSAGFLPIAGFAVYAASKAYVTSFSEGLRAELRGTGVSVCALCPGPVHTEFTDVAYRPGKSERSSVEFVHVTAETVARSGLAAIERDKPLVIPGFVMKLVMFFTRVTPMPILRLVMRAVGTRA